MSYFPHRRPRRLRQNPAMRELVAETQLSPRDFILPMFFADGIDEPREISSMPGVFQHTEESLIKAVREAHDAGVRCVDLFGVPRDEDKDDKSSPAWDPEGVLNRALRLLRNEFGNDMLIMADTCLDEFTDHGHCGVLDEQGRVDNDATLELYVAMAIAQARAGAHIVSPSGMMDGQIGAIREGLDAAGFEDVAIMAYSAKYASAFFGPFREAVGSSLEGDRRTYQQDPANYRESMMQPTSILKGADFVMVKPALPYLDVLAGVAERSSVPVAAYQVPGGTPHETRQLVLLMGGLMKAVMMESLISIKRAGADQIFTYFATEAARILAKKD